MINFFRRIRKKLLEENRLSKYLVYAGGEIILVMIGILLALQVNNWNETRIITKNQEKYLLLLKKENDANIEELNRVKLRVDSMFFAQKYLINNLGTLSEKDLNSTLAKAIGPQTSTNLENSVLSELKTTGELKNITNDALRKKLVGLEPYLLSVKGQEDRVIYQCDKARELIVDIGNMSSIVNQAGLDVGKLYNQEASNSGLQDNSKFKNILAIYIAETEAIITRFYPRLEKHLKEINSIIEEELNIKRQ